MANSKSSDKAREILEFLEKRDVVVDKKTGEKITTRGFGGPMGRLKRKEYAELQQTLADIIDGTHVEVEEVES